MGKIADELDIMLKAFCRIQVEWKDDVKETKRLREPFYYVDKKVEELKKTFEKNILELVKGCKPKVNYNKARSLAGKLIVKIFDACNEGWLQNLSNLAKGE